MRAATHTPGPWRASGCAVETSDAWRLVVAIVPSRVDPRPTPDAVAETRADRDALARLIAAAPEMLEALERLIPWACKAMVEGVHLGCAAPNALDSAINQARAAIARARGDASQPRPDPLAVLRDVLAWYAESTDADGDMPPELHARVVAAVGGEVSP